MIKDWRSHLGLFLVLGLTLVLRLPGLERSLWFDECIYSTSRKMTGFHDLVRYTIVQPEMPFYRIFMFFWISVFGEQEAILRTPSLVYGILTVFLTYLIALQWQGNRKVALIAALLLSISPVHIWYSREGAPYSLLLFFFLISVYSHFRLLEKGFDRKWFIFYWASACLAVFTHAFAAAFLPMAAVLAIFRDRKLGKIMVFGNGLILLLMICLLGARWHLHKLTRGMRYLDSFDLMAWWNLFFEWFSTGNCLRNSTLFPFLSSDAFSSISQLFFLSLLVLGFFANLSGKENHLRLEKFGYFMLLPLFLFAITLAGFNHFYIERYLLIVLPFYLIFLAMGTTVPRWKEVNIILTFVLFGISIMALTEFYGKTEQRTVYRPNPDWRAAAQFLRDRERDAEGTFLLFTETPSDALEYYLIRNGSKEKVITETQTLAHLREKFPDNGAGTVFLIRNLFWSTRMDLLPGEAKELPRLNFTKMWSFKGIEIYEFTLLASVN